MVAGDLVCGMTNVTRYGKLARGREELKKHLSGKKLSYKQALLAKCYDCMGGYSDGKMDCLMPDCPVYWYMPFGEAWRNRLKKSCLTQKSPFQRKTRQNTTKDTSNLSETKRELKKGI